MRKKHKIKIVLTALLSAAVLMGAGSIDTGASEGKEETGITGQKKQIYGIGSVSKIFGAAAVMKLVDDGKIDLDTPLIHYLPDFTMEDERYVMITPRMLLNHSSGLLGTTEKDGMLSGDQDTALHDNFLKLLETQELKADPGMYSVYCNDGYTLAEILVERVSGLAFTDFLEQEILTPLGMSDTKTPQSDFDRSDLAAIFFNGSNYELPYESFNLIASGGMYSTPEELVKFSQIFYNKGGKRILSQNAVKEMEKKQSTDEMFGAAEGDTNLEYGLGWDCVTTYPFQKYGIKALVKGGDTTSYHANLTVLPEVNMSAAVLSSGGMSGHCAVLAQEILLETLKEEGIIEQIQGEDNYKTDKKALLPKEFNKYAGVYMSEEMLEISFTEDGNLKLLTLDREHPMEQEYVYTGDGFFCSMDSNYISALTGPAMTESGMSGSSKLSFKEESNNRIYLMVSSYEGLAGIGQTGVTLPFAEKTEASPLPEKTAAVWEKRNGKEYYLINEKYSSLLYFTMPSAKVELSDKVPGYLRSQDTFKCSKIIDENTAKPKMQIADMVGRDLKKCSFYIENGAEYMKANEKLYLTEEKMETIEKMGSLCTIGEKGYTRWFKAPEGETSEEFAIKAPKNGVYYVYDKNNTCINSSIFKNKGTLVKIPANGKIAFAGEKGAEFRIEQDR